MYFTYAVSFEIFRLQRGGIKSAAILPHEAAATTKIKKGVDTHFRQEEDKKSTILTSICFLITD